MTTETKTTTNVEENQDSVESVWSCGKFSGRHCSLSFSLMAASLVLAFAMFMFIKDFNSSYASFGVMFVTTVILSAVVVCVSVPIYCISGLKHVDDAPRIKEICICFLLIMALRFIFFEGFGLHPNNLSGFFKYLIGGTSVLASIADVLLLIASVMFISFKLFKKFDVFPDAEETDSKPEPASE